MATLTVANVTRAGVDMAGVAADVAGDEWTNTGQEFIEIKNGGASPITATLDIKSTVDGAVVTDPTVSVAAGATKMIGPFPSAYYTDATTGRAKVTYSAVTSVTIKVVKLTTA